MKQLTSHVISKNSTIVELVRWRGLNQPNKSAYIFLTDGEIETDHITYGQLDRRARAIGARLQALGMRGERALLVYPPGLEYVTAFFGCLFGGVIAVPIHYPNPAKLEQTLSNLEKFATDAQAKVVLTTTTIKSIIAQPLLQMPQWEGITWLNTDNVNDSLVEEWRDPEVNSNTVAFLQYTSGSTAMPKGVMLTHRNIIHNQQLIQILGQHTEESTYVSWLPMYHNAGLIGCVIQSVYIGVLCILMSPMDFLLQPYCWLSAISRYRAHTSGGPNFAYDLCVDKILPEQKIKLDLSSWNGAFSGGEPVRPSTVERFTAAFSSCGFRKRAFVPIYGSAESTLVIFGIEKTTMPTIEVFNKKDLEYNQVSEGDLGQQETVELIGYEQILESQQIRIINPSTLFPCLPEQVGEIWVSGSSVAQGYWNRHEETERTFRVYIASTKEGPFLRTGDLGFLKDGKLFVTGRLKELIVIRGRNIYPQDIEITVQQSYPSILRSGFCAAFSVEVNGEERLVVAQEVEEHYIDKLNIYNVDKAIREAITKTHGLQVYKVLLLKPGSIPHTANGKIQRHSCRAKFLNRTLETLGDIATALAVWV